MATLTKTPASQLQEAFNLADLNFEHNPVDLLEKMRAIRNEIVRRCDQANSLAPRNRYEKMHRAMSQRIFAGCAWMAAERKRLNAMQPVSIPAIIATFPKTFGLRHYPGRAYRISPSASYVNDLGVVMLYTQVCHEGQWLDFIKGGIEELAREITAAPVTA